MDNASRPASAGWRQCCSKRTSPQPAAARQRASHERRQSPGPAPRGDRPGPTLRSLARPGVDGHRQSGGKPGPRREGLPPLSRWPSNAGRELRPRSLERAPCRVSRPELDVPGGPSGPWPRSSPIVPESRYPRFCWSTGAAAGSTRRDGAGALAATPTTTCSGVAHLG